MEKTLKRKSIFSILFGNYIDNDDTMDMNINDPQLLNAQKIVDKSGKVTEESIVTEDKKSAKNGGFSSGLKKEINPKTLSKMRENYEKNIVEREERE